MINHAIELAGIKEADMVSYGNICAIPLSQQRKKQNKKKYVKDKTKKKRTEKGTMGWDLCKKAMQAHVLRQGD